jgi:hypothetical protein
MDHAQGEGFIIDAAEDEDGEAATVGEEALEGLEPLAVREAEVQEDEIDAGVRDGLLGVGEAGDLGDEAELLAVLREELGNKARVARIVLDEENLDRLRGVRGTGSHHCGSS